MATLTFKISWFGEQAEKLEEAAAALECLRCDIEAINYIPIFEMAPIKPAYEALRATLLEDESSLRTGSDHYETTAEAIRLTGRNYALAESRNTDIAQDVERLLEEAGL